MRMIDANALKRKAQKVATESWKMRIRASVETTLNQFIDWIDEAPTVDAAPVVHGEWIEISSSNHTYKCSECGRLLVNITDGKNNVAKHYPYCHCGADMREDGGND